MSSVVITLVRHAESEANISDKNLIGGHNIGTRLTKNGEAQAVATGLYFKKKGIVFTAAYSSTAHRTQMTADICFKNMDCNLCVTPDPLLLEQGGGGWEGQSRDIYLRKDVRLALDTDNWNYIPGDDVPGESQKMVAERMKGWIKRQVIACNQIAGDHHIVVFTHGLAIKFLLAELLDLDRPSAYKIPIDNASITQLCYEEGKLVLPVVQKNNTKHLNDIGSLHK